MPTMTGAIAALLLLSQVSSDRVSSQRGSSAIQELTLADCIVSAKENIPIPAQQAGVIFQMKTEEGQVVEEGFVVHAGQVIGKLDDEDATARRKAAELEHKVAQAEHIKASANVVAAKATVEVAKAEVIESNDVNRRVPDAIPKTQVRRQELTVTRSVAEAGVAERDVEVAGFTTDLKQALLEVTDINLKKHQIISPIDGVLVQQFRKPGEWVTAGDPIARVVRMDKLRVEGFVDAGKYLPEEIEGRPVTIIIRRPNREPEEFKAVVTFASPIVEASGEYRVWADVDNRLVENRFWVLRPGMEAEMRITLASNPNP